MTDTPCSDDAVGLFMYVARLLSDEHLAHFRDNHHDKRVREWAGKVLKQNQDEATEQD